jgi:hypothetical protein
MPISRRAGYAALVIFAAFLMHTINAAYFEPRVLGFTNVPYDYARVDLLVNAIGTVPWTLSGFGHLLSGFACVYLAVAGQEMFRTSEPVAARFLSITGTIAAIGFLLTGISDLVGGGPFKFRFASAPLMVSQNPGMEQPIYLAMGLVRIFFNALAQVGLGWYAIVVSRCGLRTGRLGRALCWFGYVSGACGLLMGIVFAPLYLYTVLVWSLWYGITLLRLREPLGTSP